MHRFMIPSEYCTGALARFPRGEALHAARVLRLRAGDEVELTDGQFRRYRARLERVSEEEVCARVEEEINAAEPPVRLTLYQGIPKKDKLEWIAQKATELGVYAIVPVVMARCVARADASDWDRKAARYARIIEEAVKQCGRAAVPTMQAPIPFSELPERLARHDCAMVPWENAEHTRMRDVCHAHPEARDIALVIGPEGGMERGEVERLCDAGGLTITLGPRILRTETAAIAACACAMAMWGDI